MSTERRNAFGQLPVKVSGERKLRMVVLGASRTGKTQLVTQFMGGAYSDVYIPTIEDFHRKMYTIRGHTYQLDILDSASTNANLLTQKITLMTGDIFLIVYSVTDMASFEYAKEMVKMIEETKRSIAADVKHNGTSMRNWHSKKKEFLLNAPIILAGNKSDLVEDREVPYDTGDDWIRKENLLTVKNRRIHVNVSAKDSASVQALFQRLFSLASLPLEMSPNMHRKMSADTFVENTNASRANHHHHHLFCRSNSENDNGKFKSFSKQNIPAINTTPVCPSSPGSTSSSSTISISSDDASSSHDVTPTDVSRETLDAFATVYPHQRRPSAATEVSLVMNKAKNGARAHSIMTSSRDSGTPFQKLKKRLSRVTSSHI